MNNVLLISSDAGAGGVIISELLECCPMVFRLQWPPDVTKSAVLDKNRGGKMLDPIRRKQDVDEGLGEGEIEAIQWNRLFDRVLIYFLATLLSTKK